MHPRGDGMAIERQEPHELMMRQPGHIQAYYHEDEISLVDLFIVLYKHKTLIAIIFLLCTAGGVFYALTKPILYTYSTSIEIARGTSGLIEEPETVLAKLQESYIDYVLQQYNKDNPQDPEKIKITAKVPRQSDIVVLESIGTEEMADIHHQLHQEVVDKLSEDHGRMIAVMKRALDAEQRHAKNKLSELEDQAALLKVQEDRIGENAKLLKSQIIDVRKLIDESRKNRKQSVNEVTGEAKAMTLLLIDNEIQQYQRRLSDLEEQLAIGLENDRDELRINLADNLRAQDEQREKIQDTVAKISEIRQTRAMTPTMRSLEPISTGRKEIILTAGLLGLFIGLIATFFVEFIKKAREQLQVMK